MILFELVGAAVLKQKIAEYAMPSTIAHSTVHGR